MALTRRSLTAMGIDAEKIDEIIALHAETVEALKEQRDGYKTEAEQAKKGLDEAKKTAEDAEKERDDLKKAQAKDKPYKEKYEEIKAEYDKYKSEIDAKETTAKVTKAYKAALKDAKIADKYINVILKATDLSEFHLDEDGNLEGAKDVAKKAAEEWAEFVEKTSAKGKNTETPPNNNGGSEMTKEEIMGIKDRAERQQAISEHHELFGY